MRVASYLGIAVAVAVGVLAAVLILKVTDVVGGDSTTVTVRSEVADRAAYKACLERTAPWMNPRQQCASILSP